MTLIELTETRLGVPDFEQKVIVNFDNLVAIQLSGKNVFVIIGDSSFVVKETPEQIQKLLNEMGHFVKRVYKPELPIDSGVKVE